MTFFSSKFKAVFFALLLLGLSCLVYFRHGDIEERKSLGWVDRSLLFVTAPVAKTYHVIQEKIVHGVKRYFFLVGVEKKNEELSQKLNEIKMKSSLYQEVEAENRRLHDLLDLKKITPDANRGVIARVVSYPPVGPYRIMTIDKGSKDGLNRRDPVISADGLVGQIHRTTANYSQVLLVIDPTSAVDARIEGSEARGLIVGKVKKLALSRELYIGAFEYLNQAADISNDAKVSTSGLDGIFPAGLRIGSVFMKEKKEYDVFQQAEVVPAVDFYKLKEVLVLKK